MVNRQRNKGQVKIYNILLKIEQHEPHEKPSVNSCASEEFIVPALLVSWLRAGTHYNYDQRGHLWHRYPVTLGQVIYPCLYLLQTMILTNNNITTCIHMTTFAPRRITNMYEDQEKDNVLYNCILLSWLYVGVCMLLTRWKYLLGCII
jgi:hypothetical protein